MTALHAAVVAVCAAALVALPGPAASAAVPAASSADPPAALPAKGPRQLYEDSLGQPARTYTPAGRLGREWSGTPTYVANVAAYSRGELIFSDTPFDDSGADTVPGNGLDQSRVQEAATLPGVCNTATGTPTDPARNGDAPNNTSSRHQGAADLVEVRLAADDDGYHVVFVLQTMVDAERAVVGLGLTGASETAGTGRGLAAFRHLLEITPAGATLDGAPVASAIDPAGNTLEARLPRSALPEGQWEIAAAAGLWGASGWETVTDLAHVPDEPLVETPNCWFELEQSRVLATGAYPAATVDPDLLRSGFSSPPEIRRGPQVRLYYPRLALGEGVVPQSRYGQDGTAKVYRGLLQPYTAYVPDSYDPGRPNPLVTLLHCLNCTHDVYFWSSWPGMKRLADERGAPIVTPLAYGEGGHYEGEAEWDVFEVLADASARYTIDRQRLYLGGMSMGSLGTFRLGLLYPDLWARTFGVGNYTTPFCVNALPRRPNCSVPINYYGLLPNARNLAWGLVNGGADELTPVTASVDIARRLDELGYPWRLWVFPHRAHDPSLTGQSADLTSGWLGDVRRVEHPQRVTYRREAAAEDASWQLRHDRAYWVSDIELAEGEQAGEVDATSGRGQTYHREAVSGSGADEAGPYVMTGADPVPASADDGNRLTVVTTGVSSLAVDPQGALLCPGEPVTVDVDADRPVTLRLTGLGAIEALAGRSTRTLSAPGSAAPCAAPPPPVASAGAAPAAGGTTAQARPAGTGNLAATGAGASSVLGLVLLAGTAAVARRRRFDGAGGCA